MLLTLMAYHSNWWLPGVNGGMTPTHTIRFIYSSELIHNVDTKCHNS